ncbi:hypothetical protein [Streptomyces sp. NPDC099088]|uniref:hypothetical protein n=1 Tax=Streptomyces sp. NPDC099088 TaxID=3366101 RepID=UPI0038145159
MSSRTVAVGAVLATFVDPAASARAATGATAPAVRASPADIAAIRRIRLISLVPFLEHRLLFNRLTESGDHEPGVTPIGWHRCDMSQGRQTLAR